jgi:hypothetical protein
VPLYSEIATGTCLIRSMYGPVALALYTPLPEHALPQQVRLQEVARGRSQLLVGERVRAEPSASRGDDGGRSRRAALAGAGERTRPSERGGGRASQPVRGGPKVALV